MMMGLKGLKELAMDLCIIWYQAIPPEASHGRRVFTCIDNYEFHPPPSFVIAVTALQQCGDAI